MTLAGWLIDLAIVAGLIRAIMRGAETGLVRVLFDVGGLLLATLAGLVAYQHLSSWLAHHIGLPPTITPILAFVLAWTLVEGLYLALWKFWPLRHQRSSLGMSISKAAAATLSALSYLVLVALTLIVLVGLPLPAGLKNALAASRISSTMLASTNQLQSEVNHFINQNLSTFNFVTVEPKTDNESIALGFKVTNGTVRPDLENRMLELVNQERTSRGLAPLTINVKAQQVARDHSRDMFARGYFSHITPEGLDPFERMHQGGVTFLAAGENLALAPTLPLAHQGLMNSPGHRANILDSDYASVGIGIIDGGRYGLMITQDFTD